MIYIYRSIEEDFSEMEPLSPSHEEDDIPEDHRRMETDDDVGLTDGDIRFDEDNKPISNLWGRTFVEPRESIRRKVVDFFTDVLDLESQCNNPVFIDYLTDENILSFVIDEDMGDYTVRYNGDEIRTVDGNLTEQQMDHLRDGIRKQYDKWNDANTRKTLKKAGIITAIGLGVIALVTGLTVGLTRKGSDIVHQAKYWEKLHPSKKITDIVPWIEIEKAGGKVVIFTGEYLVVIIAATGMYLLLRSK